MSMNEQRRTKWLPSVRCFEHEEAAVREKAYDCGKSTGQFMLAAALGRRTQSKIDSHILNELRRLAGLQKHLFKESGGMHSKEYAEILVEVKAAILRLSK